MEITPAVYEHAARFVGKTPWEVSRDARLLFEAHAAAFRHYKHKPVVVGIDIYNLEAEAYGATLDRPEGCGIPAISHHICSSPDDISALPRFDPTRDGRMPMVLGVAERLVAELPGADVRIPVSGPFSIASNLMGFEALLCEVLMNPDAVLEALMFLVDGQSAFCAEIVRRGLGVAFFESAATPPLVSPASFRDIELVALKAIINRATEITGRPVPCIIGGDTFPILDYILETGSGYLICPCETDQPAFMEKMKAHPEIMVRVNMDPGVLTSGDWESVRAETDRVLALVKGREKACLGTGAFPLEADKELVAKIQKYINSQAQGA